MAMDSSSSSAVKLSKVTPEYFFDRFFCGDGMGSCSEEKRFLANDWMVIAVFSLGGFRGVLEGVGSMPADCETEVFAGLCRCFSDFSPRAAAASAVPSVVKKPDTERRDSTAGCDLLRGEVIGEAIELLPWTIAFLAVRE